MLYALKIASERLSTHSKRSTFSFFELTCFCENTTKNDPLLHKWVEIAPYSSYVVPPCLEICRNTLFAKYHHGKETDGTDLGRQYSFMSLY